jgi:rubrerythrin
VHSCNGHCAALAAAELREEEAVRAYRDSAAQCDYPDVLVVLETLIREREQTLDFLRRQRAILAEQHAVTDHINDSFA